MTTTETCKHRTTFGEWVCDAPVGHAEGQHYWVKPGRELVA